MLVTLPLEADAEQQRYFNSLDDLAAEYGVPHLNLLYADFLNTDTDYSDGAHLNVSGAGKTTAYLGDYIQQNYDIPCRYDDEKYMAEWGNAFQTYLEEKRRLLRHEEDLEKLLLMCRDEDLNCAVYVSGASSCHEDEKTGALIRNIIPMERYDEAENTGQDYFMTVDYGNGQIHEYVSPEEVVVDTSFSKLSFRMDEESKPVLQAGDDPDNLFAHDGRADICIAVFDRWTGELICTKCFKTDRVLEAVPRTVEEE